MPEKTPQSSGAAGTRERWYGLSSEDAAKNLGTTIDRGLSAAEAASRLKNVADRVPVVALSHPRRDPPGRGRDLQSRSPV